MQHYLSPLLKPQSVALVGASDQAGSLGRTVYENILAGAFKGPVYAVNPNRRRVFGRRTYSSLGAIGEPVDLAVIAAPPAAVPGILDDPKSQIRAAVLMSFPDTDNPSVGRAWSSDVLAIARRRGIRLVGPGAFGIVRTDIGLNATFCAPTALSGRLALVSQSGAVCTAMLDFATQMQIGFSTVTSLGGGIDIGFGELLDALVVDRGTDGILLYVEAVGAARPFLSALRAAARIKPVVVLKGGLAAEDGQAQRADRAPTVSRDAVFDAALKRAGTVRVHNYTQLFAAARILAMGRIPADDRLAIVANGRGPGLLAADGAAAAGVTLAHFAPATVDALSALLPPEIERSNPVDVRGDAPPSRLAAAVAATLADPGVDAVLVLHVPRPIIGAIESARAVAGVARGSDKPVLAACWVRSTGRACMRRWKPEASLISSRPRMRSTHSRFWPRTSATRNGCSKCRPPRRNRKRRISLRPNNCARVRRLHAGRRCRPPKRSNCCRPSVSRYGHAWRWRRWPRRARPRANCTIH